MQGTYLPRSPADPPLQKWFPWEREPMMTEHASIFLKDLSSAFSDEELNERIAKEQRKIDAMQKLREMLGPVFAANPSITVADAATLLLQSAQGESAVVIREQISVLIEAADEL